MNNNDTSKLVVIKDDIDIELAKKVFDTLDISEASRIDYKKRIVFFLNFVKCNGGKLCFTTLVDFKKKLETMSNLSVSTKNKYFSVARKFLRRLVTLRSIPDTLIDFDVKRFRDSKRHKKDGINDEEIKKLLNMFETLEDTPRNDRLKAIIYLLALQGLRQIELCRLDVEDVRLDSKEMLVLGKGEDDKVLVYLHPASVQVLRKYLQSNKIKGGPLFISTSNRSKGKRLSTRWIRKLVKDALRSVGITEKSTHGFRHYFITKLIIGYGGNLPRVADHSRHKSIETLKIYDDGIKRKEDLPKYYESFEQFNRNI